MKNITIAIADDFEPYRNAIKELLTTYGYNVIISVSTGKQLLEALQEASSLPNVCIVDVNMPERDGFDTAKEIRQRWPAVKILGLSVNRDRWREEAMLKSGADIFLHKNIHPNILNETLASLCLSSLE